MSQKNGNFTWKESVDLKDYFDAQFKSIRDIIEANDKMYDQRFISAERAVSAALAASDRAVQKAETAAEKRFEGVNEFRATLADQQRNLMPRNEVEVLLSGINEKVDALNQTIVNRQGQGQGAQNLWGWLVGAAGIGFAIISLIVKPT